jgi:hypothetical protein
LIYHNGRYHFIRCYEQEDKEYETDWC